MKTEIVEFKGWTLRVRPSTEENPRLLVMIHGWTGDENSMWVFARRFPADMWMIAPRAPHHADPQGFSWRPPQPLTFGRPSLEMLLPSAEALIRLIDEYAASVKIEAKQFDVIGFSQGGAMVNVLGMLFPERVHKMGVLAGFVPAGLDAYIEKRSLEGKQVFVAHGTLDELVPIDRARASMQLMEQAGASITYCEDEVGHKLSSNCLRALEEYLTN
ncbi:MAG: alpha/beta fold hydrolase [Anaerolineales bacterium]|nr:alpha/beta fold hydrolase [Anaerolineales bacterium]